MKLSLSWEVANCAATQELPSIIWNPNVHYRVHKSPPLVPINPVHTISFYLSKIHPNIVHPPTYRSSSGLFPSGFPTNILYAFLFSHIRATCPAKKKNKEFVQARGFLIIFVESLFFRWVVVSSTPNPQAGGPPFVGCPRLFIQHICSYPP
jgi:hypothetical protein